MSDETEVKPLHAKSADEMVALYRRALQSTIQELINFKSSRKKTMALDKMWLDEQIKAGKKCERCESDKDLTVDHIIPEALLILLGFEPYLSYVPQNYGVLCRRCNQFKGNRVDYANPKTKPLLKEFFDAIF